MHSAPALGGTGSRVVCAVQCMCVLGRDIRPCFTDRMWSSFSQALRLDLVFLTLRYQDSGSSGASTDQGASTMPGSSSYGFVMRDMAWPSQQRQPFHYRSTQNRQRSSWPGMQCASGDTLKVAVCSWRMHRRTHSSAMKLSLESPCVDRTHRDGKDASRIMCILLTGSDDIARIFPSGELQAASMSTKSNPHANWWIASLVQPRFSRRYIPVHMHR